MAPHSCHPNKLGAALLLALLPILACSNREPPRGDVAGRDAAAPPRSDAGAGPAKRPDGGAPAADGGAKARNEPAPPEVAKCRLAGQRRQLTGVEAADVVATKSGPLVLVVMARPRSEALAIEGAKRFPDLRALYLIAPRSGGEAEEGEGFTVTQLYDDPGPVRDPFGRRAYERLAATAGACDSAGCLVALTVERRTPGTSGAAFVTEVQVLDDAFEVQGPSRWLAQEPDRGEALAACLGASSDGFLLATAVEGGRGRLLWLDRRGTPLLHRFLPEGFGFCTAWPSGLELEVATGHAEGISLAELGGEPEPDGGPGPWRPELPQRARLPVLSTLGESRLLFWTDAEGAHLSASTRSEPLSISPQELRWQRASPTREGLLLATVSKSDGRVGVVRLDDRLEVVARGTKLAQANRVWVVGNPGSSESWLAWQKGDRLELSPLSCPESDEAPAASAKALPLVGSEALDRADRAAVKELRRRARRARSNDEDYRAAWMLERAYTLDPSDHESMVDAAGLLADIRYTKAALRLLERLSSREDSGVRSALRKACHDRDFERLWSAGEFQRLTGCPPPPEPSDEPDAGAADSEDQEDQEDVEEG